MAVRDSGVFHKRDRGYCRIAVSPLNSGSMTACLMAARGSRRSIERLDRAGRLPERFDQGFLAFQSVLFRTFPGVDVEGYVAATAFYLGH